LKTRRKSRIEELIEFDKNHGDLVIGTDEAGRGPVAGPVVAAAVYFPEFNYEVVEAIEYIDDSKRFSSNPSLRKQLAGEIKKVSVYSIAQCSVEEIEKHNILQASLLAMRRACDEVIDKLDKKIDKIDKKNEKKLKKVEKKIILVDGKFIISGYKHKQKAVKKGDSISASIAAASILAKVYRDELMRNLSQEFPVYEWYKNKGYGTAAHINAIRTHGCCEWHRKSFLSKVFAEQKKLL